MAHPAEERRLATRRPLVGIVEIAEKVAGAALFRQGYGRAGFELLRARVLAA